MDNKRSFPLCESDDESTYIPSHWKKRQKMERDFYQSNGRATDYLHAQKEAEEDNAREISLSLATINNQIQQELGEKLSIFRRKRLSSVTSKSTSVPKLTS